MLDCWPDVVARDTKAKLTGGDVATIVAMIEVWEGPLTWERLAGRVETVLGRPFSRQALDAHSKIKLAYQARKVRIRRVLASVRAGKPDLSEVTPELAMALQRASALQARVDTLQATVDAYEMKFIIWLYNARVMGLSENVLNAPLAPVDRGADIEPGIRGTRR